MHPLATMNCINKTVPCHLMESVLSGLQWDICLVNLDDIITGKTFEDKLKNLSKVFERLKKKANLKLKAKTCCLFAKEVTYFGHVISEQSFATNPSKIAAVKEWPVPSNVT